MYLVKLTSNALMSADFGKDPTKPIAIVAGFMDGSARHVVKYGEIYFKLGFDVLILLSKSSHLAMLPIWLVHRTAAVKLKNVFSRNRTVIGHVMSNGGIRSLHALDYHLGGLKISALVLDSCPSVPEILNNPDELQSIFFQSLSPNWLKELAIMLLVASLRILIMVKSLNPDGLALDKQLVYITRHYPLAPRLFLYSDSDEAVRSNSVEKAIEITRTEIFANVTSYNFGNSPHVQHFVKYKEIYIRQIVSFLTQHSIGTLKGKI